MAKFPIYELTVYDSDDTTVLFTVSTDPNAADPEKPYMKALADFAEQEVDFARGAASIGQANAQIVDVLTDPLDQTTGWFTGVLADANGVSQVNGHRARLRENLGAGFAVILDGVVYGVRLLDTYVTYELEIRDIRERERKLKAFERTDTPTIIPRGVLNGYGRLSGCTRWPIPPTRPLTATYLQYTSTVGDILFSGASEQARAELRVTGGMRTALESIAPVDASREVYVYDRWKVLWRDKATGGAYTTLTQIAHAHPSLPDGGGRAPFRAGGGVTFALLVNNVVSGATLPSNGQEIEVIVQYDGPVTEDWRYHLQGLTAGEFLRNGYRGDYSLNPQNIRYDEAALLALTTPIRARLGEPIEDFRKFAEEHVYPLVHAAPTLNDDGEISPTTYLIPDASVTLPELNDSNTRPVGGGWSHGAEDSITAVEVHYLRDFRTAETEDESGNRIAMEDRIRSVEEVHVEFDDEAVELLGWNEIVIESELLRTVGTASGLPMSGDVVDEAGERIARRAGHALLDRFSRGGQYVERIGLRDDADVEALRYGSYVAFGFAEMPDYLSGERGSSRLGQVVSRRNIDANWCHLRIVDAGSSAAPFGQPTLGAPTVTDAGVVTIPVTALASGDPAVRIDVAVSDTEPLPSSELWLFVDRVDAVGDVKTPPIDPDTTLWIRARSEARGRRPSLYTTPVSIAIPATPRVLDVQLRVDEETNIGTVTWDANALCAGVRVYPEVHARGTAPTFATSEDVEASVGELELAGLTVRGDDQVLSVRVEPYPGWTGSAVSGTAGPAVEVSQAAVEAYDLTVEPQGAKIGILKDTPWTTTYYSLDVMFNVGEDVEWLLLKWILDDGSTVEELRYWIGDQATLGSPPDLGVVIAVHQEDLAEGLHRSLGGGSDPMTWLLTDSVKFEMTPYRDSGVAGPKKVVNIGSLEDLAAGSRAELSAGGVALGDKFVAGANVTIDQDSAGSLRINASASGGASALDDLSDVVIASLADDHALMYDSGTADWRNRALVAGDVKSGIFGVARGGSGAGTWEAGAILLGNGASAFGTISPSSAGILKSDGISWSSSVLVAGDIPGLDASKIITGTFDVARIPDLAASKITAGRFGSGRYSFWDGSRETDFEATGFHEAFWIGRNLRYTGTGDPALNATYIGAAGANNQAGLAFFMKGNGGDTGTYFDWYTAPTSTGAGLAATLTRRMRLSPTLLDVDVPASLQSLSLNTDLAVSHGGTGQSSWAAGHILTGNGADPFGTIDPSGAGILKSDGISWSASTLVAGDIPGLDTSKIITGTFADARIPSLAASKITSGVFNIARIPSIPVTGLTPGILDSTSWRWRGMDGTEAEPGLAFSSQINTGIRRVSTSIIGFVAAGTDRMRVVTAGAQLLSGSAAAPSLAGLSFTTSGIYWASGVVGLSVSGTSRIRATTSGASITGTITATADVQSSVSDARLKTEIVPIDGALERVGRLHGVYHRYTDEALDRWPELKSRRRAALIAQDVAEVLPEAVVPFAGDPEYLNYLPDMVIPLLVEAIHELQDRLDALEMRRAA